MNVIVKKIKKELPPQMACSGSRYVSSRELIFRTQQSWGYVGMG